eukprot:CCRYP_017310-RA/>CCRYP_017310-RA protein AED:0.00 eAED:0.00 QI:1789/1/1/1/0/0/2/1079/70
MKHCRIVRVETMRFSVKKLLLTYRLGQSAQLFVYLSERTHSGALKSTHVLLSVAISLCNKTLGDQRKTCQ